MFIVIEGADASGKATQAKLLAGQFRQTLGGVHELAFPRYKTELGQVIELHLTGRVGSSPLLLQCMMTVDRYAVAAELEERRAEGGIIVADRWWQSGYAYGSADGLPGSWLIDIHRNLPEADYNFYIEVPLEEAQRRRPKARDLYEANQGVQVKVRENYRALWRLFADHENYEGKPSWHVIDGTGTPDEVHDRIWKIVQP